MVACNMAISHWIFKHPRCWCGFLFVGARMMAIGHDTGAGLSQCVVTIVNHGLERTSWVFWKLRYVWHIHCCWRVHAWTGAVYPIWDDLLLINVQTMDGSAQVWISLHNSLRWQWYLCCHCCCRMLRSILKQMSRNFWVLDRQGWRWSFYLLTQCWHPIVSNNVLKCCAFGINVKMLSLFLHPCPPIVLNFVVRSSW